MSNISSSLSPQITRRSHRPNDSVANSGSNLLDSPRVNERLINENHHDNATESTLSIFSHNSRHDEKLVCFNLFFKVVFSILSRK